MSGDHDGMDLAERNRAHFDATAAKYDSQNTNSLDGLVTEIRNRIAWIGVDFLDPDAEDEGDDDRANAADRSVTTQTIQRKSVRLLDYACGTGMVSRALSPYISQAIGIDVSANMAAAYNTRANTQGLSTSEMSAIVGNLLSATDPHPAHLSASQFFDFDIAAVGLGFHHFEDPALAAARLAGRLKPGGVLLVIDFLPHGNDVAALGDGGHDDGGGEGSSASAGQHGHSHGGHHHGHGHEAEKKDGNMELHIGPDELKKAQKATVQHHGFSPEEMQRAFEAAGVGKGFAYEVVKRQVVFRSAEHTVKRSVFMARGQKAD